MAFSHAIEVLRVVNNGCLSHQQFFDSAYALIDFVYVLVHCVCHGGVVFCEILGYMNAKVGLFIGFIRRCPGEGLEVQPDPYQVTTVEILSAV